MTMAQLTENGRHGVNGARAACRVAEVFEDVFVSARVLHHYTEERRVTATSYTSHTALVRAPVSRQPPHYTVARTITLACK